VLEKGAIARDVERNVWPMLESGRVAPVVSETLPLTQAGEAHRHLESGEVIGKILLIPDASS
jgi:NADPH:quinone reductase-like Zn-dependent oxidoreductase